MKIFAFMKKDLYEILFPCLLIFLIASVILLLILTSKHPTGTYFSDLQQCLGNDGFHEHPSPEELIIALMIINATAAAVISAIQFWYPWLTKTWPFQLQRSSKRTSIFWAKFCAGMLCVLISSILLWTAAFSYIRYNFPIPLGLDIWIEGLLPLGWGVIMYLATALSSILPVRLYTTRFFPPALAILLLFWGLGTFNFSSVVLWPMSVSLFLVCQIIDEIRVREF